MNENQINPADLQDVSEIVRVRHEKLAELISKGKNPFEIVRFDRTAQTAEILNNYENFEATDVTVAGRLMSKRVMGKASFTHVMDGSGTIQCYFKRDEVGEEDYAEFKKWDIGDIIGVSGKIFKTQTGEISIHVTAAKLLSKSLLPLPEKFHGLTNLDLRYRERYVDLIVNPEVKNTFVKRTRIVS
ncbi:MAG TPA: OB-fold nucleic acid binding domain-containing protein, partial [Clostridia bacterium]|nr:OB-fold nucleic acid binding domain-containing protein [Clostridia bacterium]